MTMGKGVGKTIAASAIAVLIAKKGFDVLFTDPAAHIQDFIEQLGELPAKLRVERIDPKVGYVILKRYWNIRTRSVRRSQKLILEDLKSPCTEEVAVFHAFSKAISLAKTICLIDTAQLDIHYY
jgi:arsenite-transporting ATPase